ncbi:vWA domain-containing protein [Shimazuella alba]|uniref:VWA domain-containing protein n=1 Tax=Shimazuella alba TaxID=2690964 RepID=A0A6I4VTI2_9BACL|nr:VWA domain-containing protein [Shimazuella alba]MXQ54323.1 VWA domain-containing protein [Shimazuella alba]
MKRKYIFTVLIASLAFISACSSTSDTTSEKNKQTETKTYRAATDISGMVKEGPGPYAGTKYNTEKFQKEVLNKFTKNTSIQDMYNQMVYNLAENYEGSIQKIHAISPTYTYDTNRPGESAQSQGQTTKKVHVQILLDASGSMKAKIGGKTKMELAKAAVQQFASSLQEGTDVSLRLYGHKGSGSNADKQLSCSNTEVVYPSSPYVANTFSTALQKAQPAGWTPIAKAIEDAKTQINQTKETDVENIIYIVSDGVETCGGNAVQAAQSIHQSNIKAVVNIIGFDIPSKDKQALERISQAGGGTYVDVKTAEELQRQMQQANFDLWLKWTKWGDNNWVSIEKQWSKKWMDRTNEMTAMQKNIIQELKRYSEAMSYLQKKGVLEGNRSSELHALIDKRYKMISAEIERVAKAKENQLEQAKQEIQTKIKTEQDQMTNKYKD